MTPDPTSNFVKVRVCSPPILYFSFRLLVQSTVPYRHISFKKSLRVNYLYNVLYLFPQHIIEIFIQFHQNEVKFKNCKHDTFYCIVVLFKKKTNQQFFNDKMLILWSSQRDTFYISETKFQNISFQIKELYLKLIKHNQLVLKIAINCSIQFL